MPVKQVVFILDDFSSNSVSYYDQQFGNITFFDYSDFQIERHWNFAYDGYNDPIDYYQVVADYGSDFRHVRYDSNAEWQYSIDNDYINDWTFGYDSNFGYGYYKDSYTNYGVNNSSDSNVQHGDWTLKSFMDQIDDPSACEIILVDVDTNNVGYFDQTQFLRAFSNTTSIYSGIAMAVLEYIGEVFLNVYAEANVTYIPTVFSYSGAGAPTVNQLNVLSILESYGTLIVQSTPNTTSGSYNWGQVFPNTINVGAWNVDSDGELLAGNIATLNTIDIYADGYVSADGWGQNFGTSFATPRVSAEIVNILQDAFDAILSNVNSIDDVKNSVPFSYQNLVSWVVSAISTNAYVEVNDTWQLPSVNVLTDDLAATLQPSTVLTNGGLQGYFLTDVSLSAPDTTAPTVSTFSPTDDATGVAVGSNIVVTFSETIARGTGNIELRSGSATGAIVETFNAATSAQLTLSNNQLTIDPSTTLSNSTQYFVVMASGTIKDSAGNNYTGTSTYDFTTVAPPDTTAPTVSTFSPSDGATGMEFVGFIVVTFSETIARGTGTIELRSGSATGTLVESFNVATSDQLILSGNELTIDLTTTLANGTQYFVVMASGTIKDSAGNNFTGTSTYDFTTLAAGPTEGNDTLVGTASIETINGLGGNDTISGLAGNDTLIGGLGDDTLDGGAGTDSLIGGLGDDVYIVEDAGDVVTEAASEGADTVEVTVDYILGENLENLTLLEVPHETQVVVTSYLNGQQYAESVSVGTGSLNVQNDFDLVIGGQLGWTPRRWAGGIDELRLWSTVRSAEQVAASYGSAVTGVEAGLAAYFSFDNLVGGVAEDAVSGLSATAYGGVTPIVGAPITGGASAVYLDGSGYLVVPDEGNSTLDLAGNFTIEAWIYADAWGDEFATVLAKNYSHPSDNVAYSVVRWGSEDKLTLSTFGAWSSYEAGFAAAIEPAILGPDVVNGYWHHIAFTYQTRQANDLSGTGNTLNNAITGNSGNNTLTGDAGNDTLNGGTGTDTLIGGLGDDTYVTDGGDTITEAADAGTDTVFTNVNLFLPNHVENATYVGTSQWVNGDLIGGHIVGNTGANVLMGNDGVNFLSGAGGIDNLDGKEGSDIYWFGALDIEDRTTGEINDSGVNGVDEVRFHALSGSLKLYQNDTGIERVFIGNSPGSGTSQIVNPSLPYALSVDASEVLNQLYIAGNFGANVLTGTSYSDTILGYDGSDTVIGGAGNDDIDGGAGNDSLDGGDGDDTLDGGSGSDKLDGGAGNDIYITDGGDTITEGANAGTDTVKSSVTDTLGANLENMTLTGSAAIDGTGNTLNNVITGNSSNNTLNGKIGTDTLIGGVGDDTYIINGRDTIVEEANAGTDTVRSSVTYTLANNLENLTLTGSASINGIGNALANVLVGNNGANTLVGGTGSDTLIGGAGRDILTGGLDNDLFVYNTIKESGTAALSMDLITDFVRGQDKIDLSAIDAFAGVANVNDSFIWKGSEAFSSATEGEVRYEKFDNAGTTSDYTVVWVDNDSDSGLEMAIRLTGLYDLTASDLIL